MTVEVLLIVITSCSIGPIVYIENIVDVQLVINDLTFVKSEISPHR